MSFNKFQKAITSEYAEGDFSHINSVNEADEAGDGLYRFMMRELATSEDCDSTQEALDRLLSAQRQIDEAIEIVANLPD